MGTFCFDQYQHPTLWCEEKKRRVEQGDAAESISLWKQKKAKELLEKEHDKNEYREMVFKHCPWGRPGGGAPNLDIRMRNIYSEGLQPTPKCSFRSSALPPCRGSVESEGAKIRSAADRLYISLKDHPAMSFRNKGHLDIELRYKTTPRKKGKKMKLDKIVVTEAPSSSGSGKRKQKINEEPWGKPGPGGAPWRNPKGVGSSFMRSLGWTNQELLKQLDQDNPQTTPENHLKSGKTYKAPPLITEEFKRCCPTCTCKCPMVGQTISTEKASEKKQNLKENNGGGNNATVSKGQNGQTNGQNGYNRRKSISPRLKTDMNRHKSRKDGKRNSCMGPGGVELVPLLARRRGMHRPVSLSSTDVTKRTADNNRFTSYDQHHLNELKRQIAQKRRRAMVTYAVDREMSNRHFETFENYWGRPGYGAPKDVVNKLNLDDLLYGMSVP